MLRSWTDPWDWLLMGWGFQYSCRRLTVVDVEVEASAGEARGAVAAGGVVEEGDGRAVVVEAGVVLPGEVCGGAGREVVEVVMLAAEAPDDVACAAVNVCETAHVARGH